ncbi:hypothetical protein A7D01_05180 [Xanthomonas arboricola]|uniref:hypothetical protein n=1 Tax=Xanthomonas arboricola TaxID=56448 RepID=UPI0007ECE58B|nr:hypothetical protein [Xanthomonas arboricola]OBR74066.1 hypothetical protein A7D01_05180 [Xanthomonas arboricola]
MIGENATAACAGPTTCKMTRAIGKRGAGVTAARQLRQMVDAIRLRGRDAGSLATQVPATSCGHKKSAFGALQVADLIGGP